MFERDPSGFRAVNAIDDKCDANAKHNIRHFHDASGYYIGDGPMFRVLQGSVARGSTTAAFDGHNNGKNVDRREQLIKKGILKKRGYRYVFVVDCIFDTSSPVACIVAGNPTSGVVAWGRP